MVEHASSGDGAIKQINLTLWQPKDGSPQQLSLNLRTRSSAHRIDVGGRGEQVGTGKASLSARAKGGIFEIKGKDESGTPIEVLTENLVILGSLAFWGLLWGIPGMFLAVPLTSVSILVMDHFDHALLVDARDRVLTPGLISTHAHLGSSPLDRSFVEELGRTGKRAGRGFYDYPDEGPKRLWPGLVQRFPLAARQRIDELN